MPHGVLVVDKPARMTSHDVVAQARRLFATREVGHAGTLDPMATGVLLLLFGEAKKLSGYLTAENKRYEAEVSFGRATDTLDAEGTTLEERALPANWLDKAALEKALDTERQRVSQIPPGFSAIKIDGQRAHALSRRGQAPELAPRSVGVLALDVLSFDDARARFALWVTKGYYVRSFARDLGSSLNVPAHLSALRRTASGRFEIENASSWPCVTPPPLLSVVDAVRRCLPCLTLTEEGEQRARQGKVLNLVHFADAAALGQVSEDAVCGWIASSGQLVALGESMPDGTYRVVRGFRDV